MAFEQTELWVVERYMPRASPARLARLMMDTKAAARDTPGLTYLGSMAVPADEMCFCVFAAVSAEAVEALVVRVDFGFLRIVDVLAATA